MKYLICFLLLLMSAAFNACTSLTECNRIIKSELITMVDVSDPKLFQGIRKDLEEHFAVFMQKSRLGAIEPCQRFTLRLVPIGSQETLDIASQGIEISRKGQSIKDQQVQASPAPLVNLLKTKLNEYEKLTGNAEITAGTNIINVFLKAVSSSDPEAETTIVLFTDGIENNPFLNMYKNVPVETDIPEVIEKLVDPLVMKKFKAMQEEEGLNPRIIVVLKPATAPSLKLSQRVIKNYWVSLFKELKLSEAVFIDNLANLNQ